MLVTPISLHLVDEFQKITVLELRVWDLGPPKSTLLSTFSNKQFPQNLAGETGKKAQNKYISLKVKYRGPGNFEVIFHDLGNAYEQLSHNKQNHGEVCVHKNPCFSPLVS